jgi:CRP-like cAMP-binding protein
VHKFDPDTVAQLYGATDIVRLPPGEFVFHEGDEADALYIVKRGIVRVIIGSTVFETVRPGGVIGEMAIVEHGAARSASAITATSVDLIRIDVPKFLHLVAQRPEFALIVMATMARRLRTMNQRYLPA